MVWITKYRKLVMQGEVGSRLRELIRQTCETLDVQIVKGHILFGPNQKREFHSVQAHRPRYQRGRWAQFDDLSGTLGDAQSITGQLSEGIKVKKLVKLIGKISADELFFAFITLNVCINSGCYKILLQDV